MTLISVSHHSSHYWLAWVERIGYTMRQSRCGSESGTAVIIRQAYSITRVSAFIWWTQWTDGSLRSVGLAGLTTTPTRRIREIFAIWATVIDGSLDTLSYDDTFEIGFESECMTEGSEIGFMPNQLCIHRNSTMHSFFEGEYVRTSVRTYIYARGQRRKCSQYLFVVFWRVVGQTWMVGHFEP